MNSGQQTRSVAVFSYKDETSRDNGINGKFKGVAYTSKELTNIMIDTPGHLAYFANGQRRLTDPIAARTWLNQDQ